MEIFTRDKLVSGLIDISAQGYIPSHKDTSGGRVDGAVGNLLERLLNIDENNLQLPDAGEWELKAQRANVSSLVTLKHSEPYPRDKNFVRDILLPTYGWPHKEAGRRYALGERSFRGTLSAGRPNDRGFDIAVGEDSIRLRFSAQSVGSKHSDWLHGVEERAGALRDLSPSPEWSFSVLEDMFKKKLNNTIYVIAETKSVDSQEYFWFRRAEMLTGFSLASFLDLLREDEAFVDFDARTGHNHGTKFRVKPLSMPALYATREIIFDSPPPC
jgi:hypothetical protein